MKRAPHTFDLFAYPLCFAFPHHTARSEWTPHIPLGMFLVDLVRPRVLVELGTYTGVSYSALCQAVQTLNLETQCFAIDTWQGDPHLGFYGSEVYETFRAYHDPRYSSFSTLVRGTFEEALPHFAAQSIDLLHIDGYHTYEAVRHDFETWLPKMSAHGVMLFHDINARQRDYQVDQLWAELKMLYPSFEVFHSYGLGVLAVGKQPSLALIDFFQYAQRHATSVREFFARLGLLVELTQTQTDYTLQLAEAQQQAVAAREHTQLLQDQLAQIHRSKHWRFMSYYWQLRHWLKR